ncbi:side tail fiber [Escherichia phage vB_Eco_SLUR63]|nr:side tail fiber [Escherichia phage vB_Eco_SLUR25]VAY27798.1 side tail fiber [Escherichia phage vB_Eco_SLUR63]
MATRLYGVLLDGLNKPIINATVALISKGNTLTVLNGSEAIFRTDAQGAYNVTVQTGHYKVIIGPQGIEPYKAGEIVIYSDSKEGSLNNYLTNWVPEELTPEVIAQVKELVANSETYALQAGRSAASAQADATDARNSKAASATSAAEALTYKNDSKANADAAKQAQAGAAGSANTATQAVTTVTQLKADVTQLKTDTQAIKDSALTEVATAKADAVKEVNTAKTSGVAAVNTAKTEAINAITPLKDAAAASATQAGASATEAVKQATAAAGSAATAGQKATLATEEANRAKGYADSMDPSSIAKLDAENTFTKKQKFNLNAEFGANAGNPLLIKSVNPTIKFEEVDATGDVTGYVMVMEGGNIQLQENDTGSTNVVFNYSASAKTVTLPSHKTGSFGEVGQLRTTGSYSQDSILIRATGAGSAYTAYTGSSSPSIVRWRSGLATSGGYAFYNYNEDGTYHSTPVAIGGAGTGIAIAFSTNITGRITAGGGDAGTDAATFRSNGSASYVCNLASNGVIRTRVGFSDTVGSYGFQTYTTAGSPEYWIRLPSAGGTLALQGTSGLAYKKEINDGNPIDALNRIMAQRMVTFIYKDDEQERIRFGIIAEESEKVTPQYVKHNEEIYEDVYEDVYKDIYEDVPVEVTVDHTDPETGITEQIKEQRIEQKFIRREVEKKIVSQKTRDRPSIDTNPIVMDLMGATQALKAEIDSLKAEIAALKGNVVNNNLP